ncbi:DUF3883 domain-containing protein [uncultured Polaribacter sp.]|uniref:protein NO VEIN domain-containing protein n=1 Tax=uncultured Polaribacter sp. TaxID=174711 RepID=UPI0026348957|nr:DUF3883 domain-containing protein [uncultured Polaribacter sp.]
MNQRNKAILLGLYLSKFNDEALKEFGFKSFQEAFNVLGLSIGSKPASIKNYRDEFDPYFPNNRKGWHKREFRDYCKAIYNEFSSLDFYDFSELVKSFLFKNYEIERFIKNELKEDFSEKLAKRLMTGIAAEEYFKFNYSKINYFNSYSLKDTTNMACGFDYKLFNKDSYYCIEVKGINEKKGNILLTEKEYHTANKLKAKYCLFVVKNFKEKPFHEMIFDPLNAKINFKEFKREVIQLSYNAYL